ncbi:MAG TPA: S8 family serine peptidase, partial [Planctomycetota bacterium]|nr:S8 family serine peptidase [Planctomycetota bacterium]
RVLAYVPVDGVLVRLREPADAERLRAAPGVACVLPFHPADKLFPDDLADAAAGDASTVVRRRVVLADPQDRGEVARTLGDLLRAGATTPFGPPTRGAVAVMDLDGAALRAALRHDGVLFVERWSPPSTDMDVVRAAFGADAAELASARPTTGAGVAGQVLDAGARLTHVDLAGALWLGETTGSTPHGTSTTAIAFGRGLSTPAARGMLPDGSAIGGWYGAPSFLADRHAYTAQLLEAPYRAVFQSNSWGSAPSTAYGVAAHALDALAFDLDLLVVQSQGNTGSTSSRPEAWAKNVLSVGGVLHLGTASRADDLWGNTASVGPAEDGRLKPDLVGFYDQVFVATDGSDVATTPWFSGTSAATPQVAGAAGLLADLWGRGAFGPTPAGVDVFARRPHAATLRALLVATAAPYPFAGTNHDLARAHQGFGTPDLAGALATAAAGRTFVVDQTRPLIEGATAEWTVEVAPAEPALRVALVYRDPPAAPFVTTQLVNDLDLEAIDPFGNPWRGNVGLDVGPWSAPGGVADAINPVEAIFVSTPAAGVWTLRVTAKAVELDGRPETPTLDVDFALAAFGATRTGAAPGPGQDNAAAAWMTVDGAALANGDPPALGVAGPFSATLFPGAAAVLRLGGAPGAPFLLLAGPLGAANAVFAGAGSLDLGLLGASDFSDVVVLWNGAAAAGPFDPSAALDAAGGREFAVPTPALPPGFAVAIQGAVLVDAGAGVRLTAAFDLRAP